MLTNKPLFFIFSLLLAQTTQISCMNFARTFFRNFKLIKPVLLRNKIGPSILASALVVKKEQKKSDLCNSGLCNTVKPEDKEFASIYTLREIAERYSEYLRTRSYDHELIEKYRKYLIATLCSQNLEKLKATMEKAMANDEKIRHSYEYNEDWLLTINLKGILSESIVRKDFELSNFLLNRKIPIDNFVLSNSVRYTDKSFIKKIMKLSDPRLCCRYGNARMFLEIAEERGDLEIFRLVSSYCKQADQWIEEIKLSPDIPWKFVSNEESD